MKKTKAARKAQRKQRIRLRVHGNQEKPRVVVRRSLKNLFVEAVDDDANKTLFSCSTLDKELKQKSSYAGNVKAAVLLGEVFARKAREKGITKIVFDRSGYLYHGRVKAFADSARKQGLQF